MYEIVVTTRITQIVVLGELIVMSMVYFVYEYLRFELTEL